MSKKPDPNVKANKDAGSPGGASAYAKVQAQAKAQAPGGADPFGAAAANDQHLYDHGSNAKLTTGHLGSLPGSYLLPFNSATSKSTSHDLLKALFNKSPDEVKELQQRLIAAGFKSITVNGIVDAATQQVYTTILNDAESYQSYNPSTGFTPDELINSLAKANQANKDRTTTSTQTQINLTNPVQARQTLISAMATKLGRIPTDQEVLQFTGALNAYEQANPTNTTTNTDISTDASGNQTVKSSDTSTTDKGTGSQGFNSDFASNYIQDNHGPEAKAIAHLNFYNIALQALTGGGVQTGNPT